MKTTVRILMIVMMMVMGTVSVNATIDTDTDVLFEDKYEANTEIQLKRKKCHINHIHTEMCGGNYVHDRTKVYPGMNKRLRHHIMKGHHKWHRDVCRRCHLTKKEVRKMEVQIRKKQNAKVERYKAKVEKHNAKVERHNAHKLEKQNAKIERHNAKIERRNAKRKTEFK